MPVFGDTPVTTEDENRVVITKEDYNLLRNAYENQQSMKNDYDKLKDDFRKSQDTVKHLQKSMNELQEIHEKNYQEKMNEMERRMQEQLNDIERRAGLKDVEDRAAATKKTYEEEISDKNKLKDSTPRESSRKEQKVIETSSDEEWKTVKEKKKNLKTRKQEEGRKNYKSNLTLDSVYDLTDELDDIDDDDLTDDYKGKEIRFITQVPEVEPFGNKRGQDVSRFFDEYEKYCYQCFQGRKNLWTKGLKDSLEGLMLESFKAMTADTGLNVKYDVIKKRLINQAQRMKRTSKQDKRNNFDRLKMFGGETVWAYALRLETAAIEKFGEDFLDLEDDKQLFKKFLDTIPDEIRIQVNKQRMLRKRMGAKRYSWNDLRQDLEEGTFNFEDSDRPTQEKSVKMAARDDEDHRVYSTYKDALLASNNNKETDLLFMIKATFDEAKKQTALLEKFVQPRGRDDSRGRADSRGRDNRNSEGGRSQSRNRQQGDNHDTEEKYCTYCRRTGHEWRRCRTRLGQCYACGENGHLIINCPKTAKKDKEQGIQKDKESINKGQKEKKCQVCDGMGHEAKECPTFQTLQKDQAAGN